MSKSSKKRNKEKGDSQSASAASEDAAEVAEGVSREPSEDQPSGQIPGMEGFVPGEKISFEELSVTEAAPDLPEAVTEEALSAEVPEGEVPRLAHVLEAILFASQKAVTPKELVSHLKSAASAEPATVAAAFARIRESDVCSALEELRGEVAASGRAYQVRETASGWLLCSAPGFAPWLRALYPEAKPTRLSAPALETLAIIAYRQPIARADIEAVRGVAVDGVMQTILDRGLIRIAGRSEAAGRPLLYATTQYFLDHFGLRHLDELPNAAELRHIPLPKASPASEAASPSGEEGEGESVLPGLRATEEAEGEGREGESVLEVEVTESVVVTTEVEITPIPEEDRPEITGPGEA